MKIYIVLYTLFYYNNISTPILLLPSSPHRGTFVIIMSHYITGLIYAMMWMCCNPCGLSRNMWLALFKRLYAKLMHRLPLFLNSNEDMKIRAMALNRLVSLVSVLIIQFEKEEEDRAFFVDAACNMLTYATVLLCNMPSFDTIPIQKCINDILSQYDTAYMTPEVHDKLTSLRLYAIMHGIHDTRHLLCELQRI